MRITILTLGSYGDVLPFATLGKGLKAAGHQVRVATFENFSDMIAAHGLDLHPIRGDSQAILNAGSGLALAESGQNVIRMWLTAMRSFGVLAQGYARDLSSPELGDTDVIINQLPGALYGYDLAEKLDRPMFMAAVMPLTRTRTFPMLAFPSLFTRFPGYNALSYRLAEQLVWQWFRPTINHWRKETLGLKKHPIGGYFGQLEQRRIPVLNGFSAHVVPRPPDWGDHIHLTGYWFPDDETWQPPDNLRRFIEADSAPVFIGFGSMPVRDPKRATTTIVEALKQSGLRGILHAGWAGIGNADLPDYIFKIDYVPYSWLFPQMAAVAHHGGSGTTAFGLRAGVPSVIVPFLFDQFYWGKRISSLGVGPEPIPYRQLSVERLAESLTIATTDTFMAQRAAALGEKVRAEDGIQKTVETLHRSCIR
jgi:UDP:flavonoid glycosyltransferase YjiC (YdhE family)